MALRQPERLDQTGQNDLLRLPINRIERREQIYQVRLFAVLRGLPGRCRYAWRRYALPTSVSRKRSLTLGFAHLSVFSATFGRKRHRVRQFISELANLFAVNPFNHNAHHWLGTGGA